MTNQEMESKSFRWHWKMRNQEMASISLKEKKMMALADDISGNGIKEFECEKDDGTNR